MSRASYSAAQRERTMAARNQRTLEGRPVSHPQMRKRDITEYKLEVVRFYREDMWRQTILTQHQDHRTLGCR